MKDSATRLPPGPTGLKVRKFEPLWSAWSLVQNGGILLRYLRHWPAFLAHTIVRKSVFAACRLLATTGDAARASRRGRRDGDVRKKLNHGDTETRRKDGEQD